MQCSTAPVLVSVHMTIVYVLFKHSSSCTVYNELSAVKCVYGDRPWANNNYYLYAVIKVATFLNVARSWTVAVWVHN